MKFTPEQIKNALEKVNAQRKYPSSVTVKPQTDRPKTDAVNAEMPERNDTITEDTIYPKADAIAIRAVLTNYTRSGNKMMRKLYISALAFAFTDHKEDDGNNGADLIHDTIVYLWKYNGKKLLDHTEDGQTDQNGEPITILRGAFRHVGKFIDGERQKEYKELYLIDYENEHGTIKVPFKWDVDSATDLHKINDIIKALNLTENQKSILNMRMQGMNNCQIAEHKGVTNQAIQNTLKKILQKYVALYGMPENVRV